MFMFVAVSASTTIEIIINLFCCLFTCVLVRLEKRLHIANFAACFIFHFVFWQNIPFCFSSLRNYDTWIIKVTLYLIRKEGHCAAPFLDFVSASET